MSNTCADCGEFDIKPPCETGDCLEPNPCTEFQGTSCIIYDGPDIMHREGVLVANGANLTSIIQNIYEILVAEVL